MIASMAELPHAPLPPADAGTPEEPGKAERDSRVTVRPAFEPSELARQIESSHRTSTQPPEPTFATLRESCRAMRVADLDLAGLEVGWEGDEANETNESSENETGRPDKRSPK